MVSWVTEANILNRLEEMEIDTTPWTAGTPSKLSTVILQKQREFERRTKRKFEEATSTIYLNGRGTSMLVTPEFPVTDITSITVFDEFLTADQGYEVSGYRLEETTGRVHLSGISPLSLGIFPAGNMNIQVIYTHGYSVSPTVEIPDDIQDAIEMMVTLSVISRTPKEWELGNLKAFKIGGYSETYGSGKYQGGPYYEYRKRNEEVIDAIISNYRIPLMGRA